MNTFVAGFLANPPMNLVTGVLDPSGVWLCAQTSPAVCTVLGGTYRGLGSTCATTVCRTCLCDWNNDGVVNAALQWSGLAAEPVRGLGFTELLDMFNADQETDGVIMIGEIGGSDETAAGRWIQQHMRKPVVAFIAGRTAPKGKRMGHAGAIIGGADDTAQAKMAALQSCGVTVCQSPADLGRTMAAALGLPAGAPAAAAAPAHPAAAAAGR